MGRYQKFTAEYFPHFSNNVDNDKLSILVANTGMEGYGTYFRLKEILCKSKYFILKLPTEFNIWELFLFRNSIKLTVKEFNLFLQQCVNFGLFNKELFNLGYLFSNQLLLDLDKTDLFKHREAKPYQILGLIEKEYNIKIPQTTKDLFKPIPKPQTKKVEIEHPKVIPLIPSKKSIPNKRLI